MKFYLVCLRVDKLYYFSHFPCYFQRHEKCSLCYENLMVAHEALEEKCGDHGKVGSAVRRADKALHIFDNVKP